MHGLETHLIDFVRSLFDAVSWFVWHRLRELRREQAFVTRDEVSLG